MNPLSCKITAFRRYLDKQISSFNYYYWNDTAPLGISGQIFCYNDLSLSSPEDVYLSQELQSQLQGLGSLSSEDAAVKQQILQEDIKRQISPSLLLWAHLTQA